MERRYADPERPQMFLLERPPPMLPIDPAIGIVVRADRVSATPRWSQWIPKHNGWCQRPTPSKDFAIPGPGLPLSSGLSIQFFVCVQC